MSVSQRIPQHNVAIVDDSSKLVRLLMLINVVLVMLLCYSIYDGMETRSLLDQIIRQPEAGRVNITGEHCGKEEVALFGALEDKIGKLQRDFNQNLESTKLQNNLLQVMSENTIKVIENIEQLSKRFTITGDNKEDWKVFWKKYIEELFP